MADRKLLLITAGHQNADGGNEYERQMNGNKVHAFMRLVEGNDPGFDVHCGTPESGMVKSIYGLQRVVSVGVEQARDKFGRIPDLFIELHSEGVGNQEVRGVFGIYPDAAGDLDVHVRDSLAADASQDFREETGIPIRGNGRMSEKQTGVGLEGHRLGVFYATAPWKSVMTRMILEQGAHTNPQDTAIMDSPGFTVKAALALLKTVRREFGVTEQNPPKPKPIAIDEEMTWQNGTIRFKDNWTGVQIPGKQIVEVDGLVRLHQFAADRSIVTSKQVDSEGMLFHVESVWTSLVTGAVHLRSRKGWFVDVRHTNWPVR